MRGRRATLESGRSPRPGRAAALAESSLQLQEEGQRPRSRKARPASRNAERSGRRELAPRRRRPACRWQKWLARRRAFPREKPPETLILGPGGSCARPAPPATAALRKKRKIITRR